MKLNINFLKNKRTLIIVAATILVLLLVISFLILKQRQTVVEEVTTPVGLEDPENKVPITKKFNTPSEITSNFKERAFPFYSEEMEIFYDRETDTFNVHLKGDTTETEVYAFFEQFPEVKSFLELNINIVNLPGKSYDGDYGQGSE